MNLCEEHWKNMGIRRSKTVIEDAEKFIDRINRAIKET